MLEIAYPNIHITTVNITKSANKWNLANFFKSLIKHNGTYTATQNKPIYINNLKYIKF